MWQLIRANRRRAAALVAAMALLLLGVGYALGEVLAPGGGIAGLVLALVLWSGLALLGYYRGDRILLAASGARRIEKRDHPVLWNVVEEMCIAAGLRQLPALYILDEAAPNAFATGRSPEHAAVAVTAGLLERLDRDELQGVIAHELAHVQNRDVLYVTLVGVLLGAIVLLADVGLRTLRWRGPIRRTSSRSPDGRGQAIVVLAALVLLALAPLLAQLMALALSRRREYLADACSAVYTRYPEGLARALEKIEAARVPLRGASRATAPLYIVDPLAAGMGRTHPPTAERVRILRGLAGTVDLARYDESYRRVTGRPVGVVPAGSLQALTSVAVRSPRESERTPLERARQATDALWRAQDYAFVSCACGTSIKIPPAHAGRMLSCPHCGREHA